MTSAADSGIDASWPGMREPLGAPPGRLTTQQGVMPAFVIGVLVLANVMAACAGGKTGTLQETQTSPRLDFLPARIAIVFPSTTDPMLAHAYARLQTTTGRLLRATAGSRIVERQDLLPIRTEQRWQYAEPAAENTLIPLGRLSGADTFLFYKILSPTRRERLFMRNGKPLSPVAIMGRMVRVETGEVVWDYLVTVGVQPSDDWQGVTGGFDHEIWQALDHGVREMEAALTRAVGCDLTCPTK